jgi:hypothetical protein
MPRSRRRRKKPQLQTRRVKLHPRAIEAIESQICRFREKFGRDPEPDEPIFFDPDSDVPVPMSQAKIDEIVLETMRRAGTSPEFAYAYRKTGLLSFGGDMSCWDPEDRREWEAAVAEYGEMERAAKQRKEL